jgi:hypothetical protein
MRQQQVAEAVRAAVVLLAYGTFAFCWWFIHDILR